MKLSERERDAVLPAWGKEPLAARARKAITLLYLRGMLSDSEHAKAVSRWKKLFDGGSQDGR